MSNCLILHFCAKLKIMTVHRTVCLCFLRMLFLFSCYLSSHNYHLHTKEVLPHYTGFLQCVSPTRTFQSHTCSTLTTTWALFNISCTIFRGANNSYINEKGSLIRESDTSQQIFIRNGNKFLRTANSFSYLCDCVECYLLLVQDFSSSPPLPP